MAWGSIRGQTISGLRMQGARKEPIQEFRICLRLGQFWPLLPCICLGSLGLFCTSNHDTTLLFFVMAMIKNNVYDKVF